MKKIELTEETLAELEKYRKEMSQETYSGAIALMLKQRMNVLKELDKQADILFRSIG